MNGCILSIFNINLKSTLLLRSMLLNELISHVVLYINLLSAFNQVGILRNRWSSQLFIYCRLLRSLEHQPLGQWSRSWSLQNQLLVKQSQDRQLKCHHQSLQVIFLYSQLSCLLTFIEALNSLFCHLEML